MAAEKRAEKEARKKAKHEARLAAQKAAKEAFEREVLADVWTQKQQINFENALLMYTSRMDKQERWGKVSECVSGKTINQCLARYKYLKEFIESQKEILADSG